MMMGRQPLSLLDIDPTHSLGELLRVVAELSAPHVLDEIRVELRLGRPTVTHLRVLPIALNVVGAGASDRIDNV